VARHCSNLLAGVLALGIPLMSGCGGSDGPGSYVGRASNAVIYVSWTRKDDHLSGSLTQALRDDQVNQVTTHRVSFSGTVSGSGVSIDVNQGLGNVTTLTGELDGDVLKLDYPGAQDGSITTIAMHKASVAQFNAQLAALKEQAAEARQAQEQAQAAEQARNDAQRLSDAVKGDISAVRQAAASTKATSTYASALDGIRRDLATVKKDTATVLAEPSSINVCSDDGIVQSDVGTMEADIGSIESDQGATQSDNASIADAIGQVRSDFDQLHAIDPSYLPADAPDAAMVDAAIRGARRRESSDTATGGGVHAQAEMQLKQARAYQSQADAVCTRAGG
jgi:hypothetical protein